MSAFTLPDKKHRLVMGFTQSGKTQLALYLYERSEGLNIFFNAQWVPTVNAASDIVVYTVEKLSTAINDGYRHIAFCPNRIISVGRAQLLQITHMLFEMGTQICQNREDLIWMRFFVDEIQDYFDKQDSSEELKALWKRGLRWGIEVIAITQRPADVSHTVLTQSDMVYIFALKAYDFPYFKRYGIPLEDVKPWLDIKYHFIFFDGNTFTYVEPIQI